MKANEAPEKIFLFKNRLGVILSCFCVEPDKVLDNIEYIRKDAFIEKTCEWIRENWREYINVDKDGVVCFGHWERDFKKYLEE